MKNYFEFQSLKMKVLQKNLTTVTLNAIEKLQDSSLGKTDAD